MVSQRLGNVVLFVTFCLKTSDGVDSGGLEFGRPVGVAIGGAAREVAAGLGALVVDAADELKTRWRGFDFQGGAVTRGHAHEGAVVVPRDPMIGLISESTVV